MIHVPPCGLHDLIYVPSGGAGLLLRQDFDDLCASRWLNDLIYAPSGGVGLLFRPEFDDSCASRWLK